MLTSLFSLGLLACTPDPEDTGPADTGAEIDVLSFFIYDPTTADSAPVEGVTVAFDTTDGERLEAVSDADGLAAVELDRDRLASAIAHADGRSFAVVTAANVIPAFTPGEPLAGLPSWSLGSAASLPAGAGSAWAPISGAFLNKAAEEHPVLISATTSPEVFQDLNGPTEYQLNVPTGQDFSLVALEFEADPNWGDDRIVEEINHRWVVVDHPAISEGTTIDVDFAEAIDPHTIEGSVTAPADTILADQGYLYIYAFAGSAYSGFSPSTAPGADGASYDFRLEYVDVPGYSPVVQVSILGPDGSFSALAMEDGVPSEGAQDLGLLAPPRRSAPEGDGPFDWDQSITWTPSPDGVNWVAYFADPGQIGLLFAAAEESEFALPPLPSTSTTLATGEIVANLMAAASLDEDPQLELWATDTAFELLSPL